LSNSIRLLVVEDSKDDTKLLLREMRRNGYEPEFMRVETSTDMIDALDKYQWDIVISDYVLPNFSGLGALKIAKEKKPDLPFIILSGSIGEDLAVEAMKAGAHDYIMKDNLSRLVPAINREIYESKIRKKRKEAEKALKTSENLYRTIFENTGNATMILEEDITISLVNTEFEKFSGYSKEEIEGKKSWMDFVAEGYLEKMKEYHLLRIIEPGSVPRNYESQLIDREGDVKCVCITAAMIPGTKRSVISLLDITKHKKADKIIQEREEHLRILTDNMLDMITQTDKKGKFQYVSPSVKNSLGYEPEDMLGKSAFELLHPDDLETVKAAFMRSISTNSPERVEHRYIHADGHYIWLETVGNILSDENKQINGAVFGIRDITDRKRAENKLKSSLEEKEVLLREIHHRVKNNLQVISSLLSLQSRYIKDDETLELFKESQNRVKSMTLVHEKLYQSEDLARIDFESYIKKLTEHLFHSYGVDINNVFLEINVDQLSLDVNTAIPCGLIINELVTNSMKHAFPEGKNGKIGVNLHLDGDKLLLTVYDDGIGFPENLDFRKTKSLGLRLVSTLTEQLGGNIELYREKGTRFNIIFPYNMNGY